MEQLLKWMAGIGDEVLSSGDSLRFEFLSLPKGGVGLLFLLGFLAVAAGIYFIYRRDAARLGFGRRLTLALLRVAALLCIAVVLLEPNLTRIHKVTKPGEVLLLVDSSQSMGNKDSYARSEREASAWRSLGIEDPSTYSRMDLVKKVLSRKGFIENLAKKNRVRGYRFGPGVRPLPEVPEEAGEPGKEPGADGPKQADALPPPPKLDLVRLLPTDVSTDISSSIRQALESSREARIAAVILLTDGRRNMGGSLSEVGALLRRRKVDRLLVLPVGDPAEAWTLEVKEIQAAERIFKGDPLRVSAVIRSQGYGAQTFTARLKERIEGGEERLLASTTVDVGGESNLGLAKFPPVKIEREGEHLLSVEVEPPIGEPWEEDRHTKKQKLEVLGQRLRVLLIAGGPSHEFRVLRWQLIRDKTVDASCWLLSADRDFPQDGNTVIKALPKDAKELDPYDVVIMMDPDPGHPDMSSEFTGMVAKAVTDHGLGLWWVMGEKFSREATKPGSPLKPLVEILPIEPDRAMADKLIGTSRYFKARYAHVLTPMGREHRVCRLHPDRVVNLAYWSKLPGHHFAFPVLRAKPAALVLMRHANPEFRSDGGSWPLLALQYVGAGRVLYSGTDETYYWRSVAEDAYDKFWVKGLRWLYEGKLTGGSSRMRLGLSTERVVLGQELEIYLRALNERYEPFIASSMEVRVEGPTGRAETVELKPSPNLPGRYLASYRPWGLGSFKVTVSREEGEGTSRPLHFETIRSQLESQGPMDLAALTRLAEAAGGEILEPLELESRAAGIPSRSKTEPFLRHFPLWDSWLTLILVVVFLSLEWILRKLFDLL